MKGDEGMILLFIFLFLFFFLSFPAVDEVVKGAARKAGARAAVDSLHSAPLFATAQQKTACFLARLC